MIMAQEKRNAGGPSASSGVYLENLIPSALWPPLPLTQLSKGERFFLCKSQLGSLEKVDIPVYAKTSKARRRHAPRNDNNALTARNAPKRRFHRNLPRRVLGRQMVVIKYNYAPDR